MVGWIIAAIFLWCLARSPGTVLLLAAVVAMTRG
jgi:hypothetical protein